MRCGICRAPLTVRGYSTKNGRRSPLYQPCPRINQTAFHPAAARRYIEGATIISQVRAKERLLPVSTRMALVEDDGYVADVPHVPDANDTPDLT